MLLTDIGTAAGGAAHNTACTAAGVVADEADGGAELPTTAAGAAAEPAWMTSRTASCTMSRIFGP